ncbi:RHS repeat-associated core domain-containing protein [Brevibacillus parabrevis]|uniref:Uncharacterized protein n=1 Tax=Brevibacillus parabrevis TaxID=54914 RepID=A0A4Y3PDQ3_BREPA|nr:RHS repeat-associated core domain-containing protein [Brevibacillus parabrevis]MED2253309.1 RHS repeat-associated core domain-containing protein [Brevibacillus parabrevis]WDV97053.1 hypothetical protein PSE45_08870 [Brevibacillus parabrevis]GEB31693.1 hypothetical protein BPA01_12730 [Brevibacillus parabrevis]
MIEELTQDGQVKARNASSATTDLEQRLQEEPERYLLLQRPWRGGEDQGEIHDKESGFYYLRARYYDPKMGRFVSEDAH